MDSFYIRGFPINEGNFGEVAFDGVFGVAPTYRLFTDYIERSRFSKDRWRSFMASRRTAVSGGTTNIIPSARAEVDLTRSSPQGGGHLDVSGRFGAERQFGVRFNGSYHGGDADRRPKARRAGGDNLRRGPHRATERRSPRSSLAGLRPRFAANRMLELMLMRRQHSDFLNGLEKSKDNSLSL
ncbi:hypothetical protein X759_34720 [Mesorhizobium sp. LSHC420B00]|nr:hypothetical protein X759_34720 [Mesorhizobium sp. LSHC420B00]